MSQTAVAQAPSRLGRYELLARLATGGMGEIFLARLEGAAGFEKLYVIKRVLPHLADDQRFRSMLIDEARIASKMSHPNICQVYELGEDAGQLYIAMEFLEGVTLLPLVRNASKAKEPLSLGLVAGVLQQALEGLHYAHELRDRDGSVMGIIHRDVTPSNLFVTETGVIKVLDFGIAKVKDSGANTQTGTVKGKYAYMAPEQLKSASLDRRVDVFAVGVVAFEMLALRRLFQRKTDYLTFRAVMELPIPSLAEFRNDVPPALVEVIGRALERDPRNRFATARQFSAALHDALAGHTRAWTTSEIGEYVHANFAAELSSRDSTVQAAIARGPATDGRMTMPLMAVGSTSQSRQDDDDDEMAQDFPSVDTGLHDGMPDTRDTPMPFRGTDGDTPLTDLSPAPKQTPKQGSQQMSAMGRTTGSERSLRASESLPAAPAARRSWMWPLLAIGIVGAAGGGMFFMYKAMQNRGDEGQVVVIGGNDVSVTPAGSTTPDSAAGGAGSGSASATPDANVGTVAPADAAPAQTNGKPGNDGSNRGTKPLDQKGVISAVRQRLGGHLGPIEQCIDNTAAERITPDSKDGKRRIGIRFNVKAGEEPTVVSVSPPTIGGDAVSCVKQRVAAIGLGKYALDVTWDQQLIVRN